MRSIGFPELIFVVFLLGPLVVWPLWRILSKAGYPGILSLTMLVPMLNLVMAFYLGFSEWPIERELKALKRRTAGNG